MCFLSLNYFKNFIRMLKKKLLIILFALGIAVNSGCCFHHSSVPKLPKTWHGNECDTKSLEDDPEQAKLHVFIMYSGMICSHVALRVYGQSKGSIFWDPAGGFGRHDDVDPTLQNSDSDIPAELGSVREKDVIVEGAPSINQYLAWRKQIQTSGVEIFEFNLSDDDAGKFWNIIRYGTNYSHPKGAFQTNAVGGTCGLVVAKFLHRFAEGIVDVNTVLYPHNLSKQLYKENPDRVIVYRNDHLSYYIPSEN